MTKDGSFLLPDLMISDAAKEKGPLTPNKTSALAAKLSPYKFNDLNENLGSFGILTSPHNKVNFLTGAKALNWLNDVKSVLNNNNNYNKFYPSFLFFLGGLLCVNLSKAISVRGIQKSSKTMFNFIFTFILDEDFKFTLILNLISRAMAFLFIFFSHFARCLV